MRLTTLTQPVLGLVLLISTLLPTAVHADIKKLFEAAKIAYQAYQAYDGLTSEDVHEQILSAIHMAVDEIEEAMASIAISGVTSCAHAIVIDFENFLNYDKVNQEDFARGYIRCLTDAVELMDEPGAEGAGVDRLGRAFNIVAPMTLFAYEHVDFTTLGLQRLFVEGNRKILNKLRPRCVLSDGEPGSPEQMLTCRAYNGDFARFGVFPNDPILPELQEMLEDLAARNTSYLIAKDILPEVEAEFAVSMSWIMSLI